MFEQRLTGKSLAQTPGSPSLHNLILAINMRTPGSLQLFLLYRYMLAFYPRPFQLMVPRKLLHFHAKFQPKCISHRVEKSRAFPRLWLSHQGGEALPPAAWFRTGPREHVLLSSFSEASGISKAVVVVNLANLMGLRVTEETIGDVCRPSKWG